MSANRSESAGPLYATRILHYLEGETRRKERRNKFRPTARILRGEVIPMPYAEGRIFNDADSHIMETRDWLISHADPDIREKLHPLAIGSGGRLVDKAIAHAGERHKNPAAVADAEQNLMI